ncbi:ribokinase [Paucibacter sp. PLA-PC-4]|uniref:ribokinase n=1 Tax=Paucibacter sp. PLA-PC-4 TaxID=2993655 RepID=UPI00224BA129|nr:ribokinase [Paucibacter sp. PLA-PC-4]MCX2864981.1 ribokinase [Paucibacter sp. PLA-PC-4]
MTQRANAAPQVVVVGSINMDMISHSRRLPGPGETLMGEAFVMAPGGKGANQAVAAARLGAPVAFVSRVGTRQHGAELLAALAEEGIATSGVVVDPAALPGVAVIMVASEGGENSIVYVPGSNAQLSAADVQASAALLQSAKVVVAQLEVPVPAITQAFELARAAGVTTILNAAPALPVGDALLALSRWLIVNETEAGQLAGMASGSVDEAGAAARALLQRGPQQVVVTLGAQGVLLCSAAGVQHLPARVVQAVDTVGAGDTFVGGLAAGLAEGMSAADAVRLGQAAAAIAVSRSGVQSAMPRRTEVTL